MKAKETLYMLALKPCEVEGGTEKSSDGSSPPSPRANAFFSVRNGYIIKEPTL